MGINRLNPFLKKKCPSAFITLPYSYFSGKRVAFDANNVLHKFMSLAHKEVVNTTNVVIDDVDRDAVVELWIKKVKHFINNWLYYGVTPVFVFDGDYIPEKSQTQQKRRQDKAKTRQNAEDLKLKILEIDPLERTPQMITDLRKKMQNMGYVTKDDYAHISDIISAAGIPVIYATGEGEKACSMLCIEGKVEAVYSRDTDIVALGTPLSILDEAGKVMNNKTGQMEYSVNCVLFKPILSTLGITYKTFLDFCIMSGCDFNTNIPHLGNTKAFKYLLKDKKIENVHGEMKKCANKRHGNCLDFFSQFDSERVKYSEMKHVLNYERCRQIFAHQSSDDIIEGEPGLDVLTDLSDARDRLEPLGQSDWLGLLTDLYKNLPKPSSRCIMRKPSLAKSRIKINIKKNDNNGNTKLEKSTSPIAEAAQKLSPSYAQQAQNMAALAKIQMAKHKARFAVN